MDSPSTKGIAIAAFCVSLASALFTFGQWYEAHLSRQAQETAAKEQKEEQRRSRQLAESQTMEAERANILAQRKLNPKLAKDESDMPKLVSYHQTSLNVLISLGGNYDAVRDFLNSKERSFVITNRGGSTAYDVLTKNFLSVSDKGESGIYLLRGLEEDHQNLLAPGASMTFMAEESKTPTQEEFDAFHKGDASYYMSGGFSIEMPSTE